MCDCLIIGFNDSNFQQYVEMVRSFGAESGAFQDLDLAMVTVDHRHYRALEILSRYRHEGQQGQHKPWHNVDFVWPTITYLGSFLTDWGFSFDYVNIFHLEKEKLKTKLLEERILTIAITTTLYVIPDPIVEIIEFIKRFNKTAKIIVGGPYIGNQFLGLDAADLQEMLGLLGADIYVDSTEGEQALANVIKTLKNGSNLDGIANIAYRKDDRYVIGPKVIESNALEATPINYGLFPKEDLGEFISLRTAKSCPFACSFCGFPQRAGKYNYTSVAFVEQELNKLWDLGSVTTLTFLDDTFNVPLKRFEEILRMMIRNKYGFRWNSFLRSDYVTEDVIGLMAEAGCEGVFLGAESGSDTMLEKMNKTARASDYEKAISLLKAAGIFTHANLIIGFPGETLQTFNETYDFIERVQPDTFRAQLWYADPRTPVWKKTAELGIQDSGFNWSHATMDCQTACHLIEKMFLSIQNSIWLPQNGFELWSIYYLQRKGMTRKQIKIFIQCFNAVIREKLVCRGKEAIHPVLLDNLIKSCRYDSVSESSITNSQLYSATEYYEAEQFFKTEFEQEGDGQPILGESDSSVMAPACMYFKMSPEVSAKIQQMDADMSKVLLAGFALALGKWKQRSQIPLLADMNGSELLPLIVPVGEANLREVVRVLGAKIDDVREWANYAFYFLTRPGLMAEHGNTCPVFEFGYEVSNTRSGPVLPAKAGSLNAHARVQKSVKVRLVIMNMEAEHEIRARLYYDPKRLSGMDIEQLVCSLESIFSEQTGTCSKPKRWPCSRI